MEKTSKKSHVDLWEAAVKARLNAYAPISGFKVGAALLTKSGMVYQGCNIEDPSGIGITNICAERCAIIKAISEGERDVISIAIAGGQIAGGKDGLITCFPCGVCRQYLHSFSPAVTVICGDENGTIKEYALATLLPHAFTKKFTHQEQ
ncbi:MAG: cytidine deaminase [Lachnospiraceae bacterium]|jgi:cytidine deaminase|nr:cytidine deaminase [Lachnospiraceae bacterium]